MFRYVIRSLFCFGLSCERGLPQPFVKGLGLGAVRAPEPLTMGVLPLGSGVVDVPDGLVKGQPVLAPRRLLVVAVTLLVGDVGACRASVGQRVVGA